MINAAAAMDHIIQPGIAVDYVVSSTLAQASVKIDGQWFQVQIFPQTEQEIIDSFGQAD